MCITIDRLSVLNQKKKKQGKRGFDRCQQCNSCCGFRFSGGKKSERKEHQPANFGLVACQRAKQPPVVSVVAMTFERIL